MHKSREAIDQQQAAMCTDNYCNGWRYNFKKGTETCMHKHECKLFQNYSKEEETYNLETIRFNYQKDFRKCKRWQTEC